jgi:hypothetical protein
MALNHQQTISQSKDNTETNTGQEHAGVLQPWHRDTLSARKLAGPDGYEKEKNMAIQHCLSRINTPGGLVLGKNRQGEKMVLNLATEEDLRKNLISIRVGLDKRTHKTWKNTSTFCMKKLSLYYGQHNVGNHKAWQTIDGIRRPAIENSPYRTEPFCDNIILEFDRTKTTKEPIITATELMNYAGLDRHKRNFTRDSAVSFHPSLIGRNKIKVSLANVSLLVIELVRKVLVTPLTTTEILNHVFLCQWVECLRKDLVQLSQYLNPLETPTEVDSIINSLAIQEMFKLKNQENLKLTEFDITRDYSGCLDSETMIREAEQMGYQVVQHKCGLNCVKLKYSSPSEVYLGSDTHYHSRTYNKWLETWQQGFARSDEISCKSAYSLNPSTTGLRDALQRPEVQTHGITRNELTFFAPNIPGMAEMIELLDRHSEMVVQSLVSCSLQDQLHDMETYVKRSILVYWPEILPEKLRLLRLAEPDQTRDSGGIAKQLEGGLVRWMNKETGKFNGVPLLTPLTSRTSERSSWAGLMNLAALGTTCQSNPMLFLGVYGHDQFFNRSLSKPEIPPQHLWFLALQLNRTGEATQKTYLPYSSDFKTGNFKNMSTSFHDVGINVNELSNIRPACLSSCEAIDYARIPLDIDSNLGAFSSPTVSEPSSEGHAQILTCPKTPVYSGEDLKHLPADFIPWTKCVCKTIGRGQVVDFEVLGCWFRVPKSQAAHITQLKTENPNVTCLVKRRTPVGGLVYQVVSEPPASSLESQTTQLSQPVIVVPTNSKSAKELPVQNEPMTIIGAKYDGKTLQVSLDRVGNFFIPKSVVTQIKDSDLFHGHSNVSEALSRELVGYQVLHTESRFCHVKGNTNKEEVVTILDNESRRVASNVPSSCTAGKHTNGKRYRSEGESNGSSHDSKRQCRVQT